MSEVLIVEDNADWLEIYSMELASEEYSITTARTVKKASKLLDRQEFAVVATDLKLLGASTGGFDILEMVRDRSPDTQVIIFTGVGGKQDAFEAMRRGAYDYVTKPLDYDHVRQAIQSAIEVREQKLSYRRSYPRTQEVNLPFPQKFVGSSQIIKQVLSQVAAVVNSTRPVLICGAAGTGKALIAETIHLASKRHRFVLVNCASFSETILERTLFGFQKDAFPGAVEAEPGLLEQSSGGTLVLDKVNGLSPRLQRQLYAALQHQRTRRMGSSQALDIEVRVLATSQLDLNTHVTCQLFSQELYEYLSDSLIKLPALKERKDEQTDDVLLLTGYFLDKYAQGDGPPPTLSDGARKLLQSYDFPGNVRELEEVIRIALLQAQAGVIEPHHLPEKVQNRSLSTKLIQVTRTSLPEKIICAHGYSLTDQVEAITRAFDSANYFYLGLTQDVPDWCQMTVVNVLSQFNLHPYEDAAFSNSENSCSICQPLLSTGLAIFDISTPHPTILYQLGLAHAIGLPCAILKRKDAQSPTGLGRIEWLEYHDEASLRKSLLSWLQDLASSI